MIREIINIINNIKQKQKKNESDEYNNNKKLCKYCVECLPSSATIITPATSKGNMNVKYGIKCVQNYATYDTENVI